KLTEHTQADLLDLLLLTITQLHFATDDDRYVLRARIAQELRRGIDRGILHSSREICVVLKPTEGKPAEMEFRNNRFEILRLTDLDTGEVTLIDRFLFLSMEHYWLSNKGVA